MSQRGPRPSHALSQGRTSGQEPALGGGIPAEDSPTAEGVLVKAGQLATTAEGVARIAGSKPYPSPPTQRGRGERRRAGSCDSEAPSRFKSRKATGLWGAALSAAL